MASSTEDDRGLQWASISDFRAGIISNSNLAAQSDGFPLGDATGSVPAPLGAAQEVGTINCIALPSGGLAPLPSSPFAVPAAYPDTLVSTSVTTGLFVIGPITLDTETGLPLTDCVLNGIDSATPTGDSRKYEVDVQYVGETGTVYNLGTIFDATDTSVSDYIMTMTGGVTMANSVSTNIGYPCWALSLWFLAGGPTYIYEGIPVTMLWPDPANPGTGGNVPYLLVDSYPAQTFTHQNRVVNLQMYLFAWGDDDHTINSNEVFNYTEPPNGIAMGTQGEVFVQEHPTGVGAWGSVSAGELFLVKHSGGGYVINGDLNSPTVTYLGGVVPTRGVVTNSEPTLIGICYAVGGRGVWAWNGNSTSQKISASLDDDFFVVPGFPEKLAFPTPSVSIIPWGDWIAVSNGWLFDSTNGGWWRIGGLGNDVIPWLWYGTGFDGDTLYAAQEKPSPDQAFVAYKRSIPAPTYKWMSHPIPHSVNRNLLIREVVVRVQGIGEVTVTVTGVNGNTSVTSPATVVCDSDTQSQVFRFTVGDSGSGPMVAQDVTVAIHSIGTAETSPVAPIVYSVNVGYTSQNPVSPT